jgi:glycosyltransferase involved in cell wall biosynthesis
MPTDILNSRVYSNPYQSLLYTAIRDRYCLEAGTPQRALARQKKRKCPIYHIHWEEAWLSGCESPADAGQARRQYVSRLRRYIAAGGRVVWTFHNSHPHECRFQRTIQGLREDIISLAERILVHNMAAHDFLRASYGLTDSNKVRILRHPSYLGTYEPVNNTVRHAGLAPLHKRRLLCFGHVRPYKKLPKLLDSLPETFMQAHGLSLQILGKPVRADTLVAELHELTAQRPEIQLQFDSVPTAEVAQVIRSFAGLIVPYHEVVTSGVAVLGLTLGVPTIAPDIPAMRELFPKETHHLLYKPRSIKDLQRAVLDLANMSDTQRRQLAWEYLQQAFSFHPRLISGQLGAIYDELTQ